MPPFICTLANPVSEYPTTITVLSPDFQEGRVILHIEEEHIDSYLNESCLAGNIYISRDDIELAGELEFFIVGTGFVEVNNIHIGFKIISETTPFPVDGIIGHQNLLRLGC